MADSKKTMTRAKVKRRLKVTERALNDLIDAGELEPFEGPDGKECFEAGQVTELLAERAARKDPFIEQQTSALKNAHEHINNLLQTVMQPIQGTHSALLEENKGLRARIAEVEKMSLELHQAYGEMMKSTVLLELEIEQEKARMRQKDEALGILKTQVIPVIAESYGARKLVGSLSIDQMSALIETDGVLTDEQAKILKRELQARIKQRQKEASNGKQQDELRHAAAKGREGAS